jgi:hypothetical protein
MSIQIEETHAVELTNGDPGYCYPGHVDLEQFLEAVRQYEVDNGLIDRAEDCDYTAHHRWKVKATETEAHRHGLEELWWYRKIEEPGSEPVTVALS